MWKAARVVKDTDNGKQIAEEINDLMNLLEWYNT